MMKINLQAKNPTVSTNTVSYTIDNNKLENFLQVCEREVMSYSKDQKKKLKLQISATLTGLLSTLKATAVFAATQDPIVSPDLIQLLVSILVACVIIGFVLSIILLVIAGMGIMLGKKEKAKAWSIDIIKGAGQVLLAPTIILVMVAILGLLLGGSGVWIDPTKYFPHPVFGN